jgi:hypothetical protein
VRLEEFQQQYREHEKRLNEQEYNARIAGAALAGFAAGIILSLTIVSFIFVT